MHVGAGHARPCRIRLTGACRKAAGRTCAAPTTEISPSICQEWVRFSTVASYIGPSRPACSHAIRLFRSVDAPSAPIPQRQTMMLEIVAAAPVTVNMMLLKTTCPIISTSTASIALSPLVNSAEISRPMQLDENINEALRKIDQIDKLERALPGLDCGSCGAPTCAALAEDVVRGKAAVNDCTVLMRRRMEAVLKALGKGE